MNNQSILKYSNRRVHMDISRQHIVAELVTAVIFGRHDTVSGVGHAGRNVEDSLCRDIKCQTIKLCFGRREQFNVIATIEIATSHRVIGDINETSIMIAVDKIIHLLVVNNFCHIVAIG